MTSNSVKPLSRPSAHLLQVLAMLIFSGCSVFGSAGDAPESQSSAKSVSSSPAVETGKIDPSASKSAPGDGTEARQTTALPDYLNPRSSKHPIEVVWSAPDREAMLASKTPAPDFYIIEYGLTPDADKSLRIPARQLVATSDDVFGSIYRVYLHDTPEDQVLYVRIRSATDSAVSEPSATFEIHPGTGWGKRLGSE